MRQPLTQTFLADAKQINPNLYSPLCGPEGPRRRLRDFLRAQFELIHGEIPPPLLYVKPLFFKVGYDWLRQDYAKAGVDIPERLQPHIDKVEWDFEHALRRKLKAKRKKLVPVLKKVALPGKVSDVVTLPEMARGLKPERGQRRDTTVGLGMSQPWRTEE